jgi:dTDP-L-rhamnose 4-epimerase
MHVLITGGAGFIGCHLAAALLEGGHDVTVLDCLVPQVHPSGRPPPELPGRVRFLRGDVRDPEALTAALTPPPQLVYHLAAETGTGQSMYEIVRYVDANLVGTARLLEEVARVGKHPRVVLASSRAVYGEGGGLCSCDPLVPLATRSHADLAAGRWEPRCARCGQPAEGEATPEHLPPTPSSIYGVTKLAQEELLRVAASAGQLLGWSLRLQNVYGPGQALHNPYTGLLAAFFGRLVRGEACELYEDGEMTRDLVFVTDVVEALLAAGERTPPEGHEVVNVGSGRPITIRELEATMRDLLGGTTPPVERGTFRAGDVRHAWAAVHRARGLLDWRPRTGLREGLAIYVDWARQVGAPPATGDPDLEELRRRNLGR